MIMAMSKSKDGTGRVNAENIGGAKVPRRAGLVNEVGIFRTCPSRKSGR